MADPTVAQARERLRQAVDDWRHCRENTASAVCAVAIQLLDALDREDEERATSPRLDLDAAIMVLQQLKRDRENGPTPAPGPVNEEAPDE